MSTPGITEVSNIQDSNIPLLQQDPAIIIVNDSDGENLPPTNTTEATHIHHFEGESHIQNVNNTSNYEVGVLGGVSNAINLSKCPEMTKIGEILSPQRKKRKAKTNIFDEEATLCPICFESWTSTGKHRICCLKCGHLFGQKCIERWIQERKKCPNCNEPARKTDIRTLFFTRVTVLDASAKEAVEKKLEDEVQRRKQAESERNALRVQVQVMKDRLTLAESNQARLQVQAAANKGRSAQFSHVQPNGTTTMTSGAHKMQASAHPSGPFQSSQQRPPHLPSSQQTKRAGVTLPAQNSEQNPFHFFEHAHKQPSHIGAGGCKIDEIKGTNSEDESSPLGNKFELWHRAKLQKARVIEFGVDRSGAAMAFASVETRDRTYGVMKMSLLDPRHIDAFDLHSQPVRDVKYSSASGAALILTTAFDRKLKLTSPATNNAVLCYDIEGPGWSCAWGNSDPNQLFCGLASGLLLGFDMRVTGKWLSRIQLPDCHQPVHSLWSQESHLYSAAIGGVFISTLSADAAASQTSKVDLSGACASLSILQQSTNNSHSSPLCLASLRAPPETSLPASHTLFHPVLTAEGQEDNSPLVKCQVQARLQGHQSQLVMSRSSVWQSFVNGQPCTWVGSGDEFTQKAMLWSQIIPGDHSTHQVAKLRTHSKPVLDVKSFQESASYPCMVATLSEKECYLYKYHDTG